MANGIVWRRYADQILETGNMAEESEATIPPLNLPTIPEDELSPQQDGNEKPQQILSDVVCDHSTVVSQDYFPDPELGGHRSKETQTALLTETTSTVTTPISTETSTTHIPPLRRSTRTKKFPNKLGWDL